MVFVSTLQVCEGVTCQSMVAIQQSRREHTATLSENPGRLTTFRWGWGGGEEPLTQSKRVIYVCYWPTPVAAQCKALVYGRTLAEIVGSNPAGGMIVCVLYSVCVVR
jgi:hypothetical protein